MEIAEARGKKYYSFDFLPYCKLVQEHQFQNAAGELERLVKVLSPIDEWWAKQENIPLAVARAYEAYILCSEWLNMGESIEKVFYDEGRPRVVKKR